MSYEQESDELIRWYKEENKKIDDLMLANPVKGLDHPLEREQARLHMRWLGKMADLDEKYGRSHFVEWREWEKTQYIKEKEETFAWYRAERKKIAPDAGENVENDSGAWVKTPEGEKLYQEWLSRLRRLERRYEVVLEYMARKGKNDV